MLHKVCIGTLMPNKQISPSRQPTLVSHWICKKLSGLSPHLLRLRAIWRSVFGWHLEWNSPRRGMLLVHAELLPFAQRQKVLRERSRSRIWFRMHERGNQDGERQGQIEDCDHIGLKTTWQIVFPLSSVESASAKLRLRQYTGAGFENTACSIHKCVIAHREIRYQKIIFRKRFRIVNVTAHLCCYGVPVAFLICAAVWLYMSGQNAHVWKM